MNIVVKGVIKEKIFFNVYKNRKKNYFMFINVKKYNTSLAKIITINCITSLNRNVCISLDNYIKNTLKKYDNKVIT